MIMIERLVSMQEDSMLSERQITLYDNVLNLEWEVRYTMFNGTDE